MFDKDDVVFFIFAFVGIYALMWAVCFFTGLVDYGLGYALVYAFPSIAVVEFIALMVYLGSPLRDIPKRLKEVASRLRTKTQR